MLHLARHAIELFLEGKLFRDTGYFYRRLSIVIGITLAVMLIVYLWSNSIVVASIVAGALGGASAPYLFEDVRYR